MLSDVTGLIFGCTDADDPDLEGHYRLFIDKMRQRKRRRQPIVIIIDGRETGVGKSTLGMQICRDLDDRFTLSNFTYSARETLDLYGSPGPWMMVDWDESVLGLLTRKGTRDEELTGIISALSIVRKNGRGTVLTVPKIMMLDALVYNGLAPIWIFVEGYGRARVHRAWKGAQYKKSQPRLPYDLWEDVSPMGFRNLDRDTMFRASVEQAIRRNREYFQEQARISDVKKARLLGLPRPATKLPSDGNVPERPLEPTGGAGVSYDCPVCGRSFDNSHNLRAHRCQGRKT